MSLHISLWIQRSEDPRATRNFFYDAAKCDLFWVSPERAIYGPPDDREREHHAVFNASSIIDITDDRGPEWDGPELRINAHVWFTLNDKVRADEWLNDSIVASARWLAAYSEDALLAVSEIPVLMRKDGEIWLNVDAEGRLAKFVLNDGRAKQAMEFLASTLKVEGLCYQWKPLPPL